MSPETIDPGIRIRLTNLPVILSSFNNPVDRTAKAMHTNKNDDIIGQVFFIKTLMILANLCNIAIIYSAFQLASPPCLQMLF